MLGAIVGDIVGSVYEFDNIKTKDFPLFQPRSAFTDDTVMTLAVAEALQEGGDFVPAMKKYGRLYPLAGYGGRMGRWLRSDSSQPFNSWGNGSAMRVSPCAWAVRLGPSEEEDLEEVTRLATASAAVTHDHPEGIKGAVCAARAICLMRHGRAKNDVPAYKRKVLEDAGRLYGKDSFRRTLDGIRPGYAFHESCQRTVPEALIAFLESRDFEDAIRCAVSLGGDSDTLAAITGSIAEAAYGIPAWIAREARSRLDARLLAALDRAQRAFGVYDGAS
ncbi:MAG: ADP-ribosylglycohydrolase family protein [Christensenellales bacterium]